MSPSTPPSSSTPLTSLASGSGSGSGSNNYRRRNSNRPLTPPVIIRAPSPDLRQVQSHVQAQNQNQSPNQSNNYPQRPQLSRLRASTFSSFSLSPPLSSTGSGNSTPISPLGISSRPSGGGGGYYTTPPSSTSPLPRQQSLSPESANALYRERERDGTGSSDEMPLRGRGSAPRPPSYARSALDRSPSLNPLVLDDRPSVPPPIYLRSSSPQGVSNKGVLKIHIPAWGIVLVRPPRKLELHPVDTGAREPPVEDTVLSGAIEVIMKERKRVQAISVGVQSVCRLHMGVQRGWEEDGIFERGVEVLGGDEDDGMWLEKGSHTFKFSILLPATLATHDHHEFCRLSYIITARVEGIPASSGVFSNIWKKSSEPLSPEIPFREDFETVIARSDKIAQEQALSRTHSRDSQTLSSGMNSLGLGLMDSPENDVGDRDTGSAIAIGEGSPTLTGLYHRRLSSDIPRPIVSPPTFGGGGLGSSPLQNDIPLSPSDDRRSIMSSGSGSYDKNTRTEKGGWMKGDLTASRSLVVHANPSPTGGVNVLDIRKEGFVDGLGSWKFGASTDVFSISAVALISISFPTPSPLTTIFFIRFLLVQSYHIISPRTPNKPPHKPEAAKNIVLYQVGKLPNSGIKCPGNDVESLWRGVDAGGSNVLGGGEDGWKTRAMMRMPNHDKIRPSTNEGTITPIRVEHQFQLQVFYSVQGETVAGAPILGPGELRMMAVRMPIIVPSCCCTTSALNLPTYDCESAQQNIDQILASPPTKHRCMCGSTFAELGEAAMKRLQLAEQEELEERMRSQAGGSSSGGGGAKGAEADRAQAASPDDGT